MNKKKRIMSGLNIKNDDLVLGIGSGHNPFTRSDILVDKFPMVTGRHRTSLMTARVDERPFIIGDAQALPFADGAFDAIVSRHILEHLPRPEEFVAEITRVGKRGYISTPSPFTELIHGGYIDKAKQFTPEVIEALHHGKGVEGHKWIVLALDNHIYLTAKSPELYSAYLMFGAFVKKNTEYTRDAFFANHPRWRETEMFWESDKLQLSLLEDIAPEERLDEPVDLDEIVESCRALTAGREERSSWKRRLWRKMHSGREINLEELLACPLCKQSLVMGEHLITCRDCGEYPVVNGVPLLLKEFLNKAGEINADKLHHHH